MKLSHSKDKVLTIIGPTASGKTEMALLIADRIEKEKKINAEIISADSRQVFKHIPIATAQPSAKDLKKVKHHFISELELSEDFNAAEFGRKARCIIDEIFKKGKIPIIVGGSGLYVHSLVYGLFDYEKIEDAEEFKQKQESIRKELYFRISKYGLDPLITELEKIDPETFNKMKSFTERKIIRVLEVFYLTGVPISAHQKKRIEINFEPVIVGINWERQILYDRINKRTDSMIERGLMNEAENLKRKGYHYKNYISLNTVGVREASDYLDNKISYTRMLQLIKQNSRRYAKRQLTWFRKEKNIKWFDIDENTLFMNIADKIFKYYLTRLRN